MFQEMKSVGSRLNLAFFRLVSFRKLAVSALVVCWALLCVAEDFSAYAHAARICFPGYVGTSTLSNFPVRVKLSEGVGGFSHAACALADGRDVRFTRGDGEELPSECVSWNLAGTSEFYVRVPELTGDSVIYAVWGNATAGVRPQASTVWDDAYTAVWSWENEGPAVIDVSGNSNHGSAGRTLARADGIAGRACVFSAADSDYARAGRGYDDSFSTENFTYEGWFKVEAYPTSQLALFGYSVQDGNYNSAAILRDVLLDGAGKVTLRLNDKSYTSSTVVECGVWHQVAVSYVAATKAYQLFVDGAVVSAGTFNGASRTYQPANRFQFATANHIKQQKYFDGMLDEIRVSRTARSADYLAAVYKNMTDANFVSISEQTDALPAVDPLPKRTYTITVSCEAGGTVTHAGENLVEEGGFLEVTASYPTADRAFYAWSGDCPTTAVFSATIRIPADRDRALFARFGTAYPIAPNTEADAIKAGLDQIAAEAEVDPTVLPAVLLLSEGTYPLTNPYVKSGYAYTISNPISVRSADGIGKAVLDFNRVDGRSAFKLDSMGAVIDGLTFYNAAEHSAYSDNAVVAFVNKGHLLNCTVDTFRERSDSDWCVKVNAGWISGCKFLNATSVQTGTRTYPITLAGGTLMENCIVSNFCGSMATVSLGGYARNCLFVDCSAKHASNGKGGAIQIANSDGKTSGGFGVSAMVENCTFVNCSAIYGGALAYALAGIRPVAVNCAFLGNTAANAAQGHDTYGVTLLNCVSAQADAVDGNLVSLPIFTETVGEPAASSPTRNAALSGRWASVPGVVDLVGTNRIEEGILDIGCREFPKPAREALAVNVTASVYEGRDSVATAFAATVTGDRTGLSYDWDFGDGSAHVTEAAPTHTYVSCGYYTVTLTVANAAGETSTFTSESFVRVLPSVCYVRAAGESVPTLPYATPETAANRLCDVLSIAPSVVDLGPGDIELGDFCNVTQPMVIRGKGTEQTRLKADAMNSVNFGSDVSPVFLKHAGAVLADVTLWINQSCNWASPLTVQAGMATNCVIRNNRSQNASAVRIVSGALVGCTILDNSNTYGAEGAVCVVGAGVRIENCVFRGNLSGLNRDGWGSGSALQISGNYAPAPTVRNCLFVDNHIIATNGFGAICANGSVTIDNCTVVSNACIGTRGGGGLYVSASAPAGGVRCRNTIFWGNVGAEDRVDLYAAEGKEPILEACSVGVDPCFKNPSQGDWRLRVNSPGRDKGLTLEWMTEVSTDLMGNPRRLGAGVDLGCYESTAKGVMIIIR